MSKLPGLASRALSSSSSLPGIPTPESVISSRSAPSGSNAAAMRIGLVGGEYMAALSSSSASRWMRPPAAGPATAAPFTGWSRTRSYCSISEVAARKTSAMGTGRVGARAHDRSGEDEEVVVVAAHPRREVVEPEQVAQLVGVLLGALQLVDDGQLLLDHRLAATRHADEGVVQRAPQPHLGRREPDGLVGEAVDGAGHLGRLGATGLAGRQGGRHDDLGVGTLAVDLRRRPRAGGRSPSRRPRCAAGAAAS